MRDTHDNIMNKVINFFKSKKVEWVLIASILVISAVAHGYNMFQFPYYENDEGVYMSQAWSIITQGQLAPYTYWYDHAPAGWIFIALWNLLTGGFFTFGFSINSGRVFMLVLHVLSSFFLYMITKKLTGSKLAGALSVIIFSLSPLGIYFQRRVLLDNIMVFWCLLSLYWILFYAKKLRYMIFSGIAFGIALLSKETAVFFAPVYLYVVWAMSHAYHRVLAVGKWISVVGVVVSLYFLYAFYKNELFPSGTWLGGTQEHVSLVEALQFQSSRKGGSILDFENSSFWYNMRTWIGEDPVLIYYGMAATVANLFFGIKHFGARVASLLSVSFWAYLMRGGLVIEFYVVPLIPILALNIAIFIERFAHLVGYAFNTRVLKPAITYAAIVLVSVSSLYYASNIRDILNVYTSDQTTVQVQAVDWILEREQPNTFYVVDNYSYIDLQERKKDESFRTEWYWKVDKDPDVRDDMLKGDKENIDYVALTPQMKNDIAFSGLGLTLAGWKNSEPIHNFAQDRWEVDIWGSISPDTILKGSWESYKKRFIVNGEKVVDPGQNNMTTSEGQSYALLRAVWLNDRESFDKVYAWSKKNMQQKNKLFAWKYQDNKVIDKGNASDADQDIALALLFASKKWNEPKYQQEALPIIKALWNENVVTVKNRSYLAAGTWADKPTEVIINPSYLSPAHYRIFSQVDLAHNWNGVVDSSYVVLEQCTASKLDKNKGGLPPEWCAVDKRTLSVKQPSKDNPRATEYSYNAFRTPWRIALDYQWNKDIRAKNYLSGLTILNEEYTKKGKLAAAYQHNGEVWEDYESVAAYGGNIGYFMIENPEAAKKLYKEKILKKFYQDREKTYWDDANNYYTQNWAWFGTGLMHNQLKNLWTNGQIASN